MGRSDDGTPPGTGVDGLPSVERSLRRALATTNDDECRYHIRTALQRLAVVRARGGDPDRTADVATDRQ